MRAAAVRLTATPPKERRVLLPERDPASGRYGSRIGRDDKERPEPSSQRAGLRRTVAVAAVVAAGAIVAGGIMVFGGSSEKATAPAPPAEAKPSPGATVAPTVASTVPASVGSTFTELAVVVDQELDNFDFDESTDYVLIDSFDRTVGLDCDTECELVFDDAVWLWDYGLRLPIVDGRVDTTLVFEERCVSRDGADHGAVRVDIVVDLAVVATADVNGRQQPTGFTGTMVYEYGRVQYETANGQGECTANRFTVHFPTGGE